MGISSFIDPIAAPREPSPMVSEYITVVLSEIVAKSFKAVPSPSVLYIFLLIVPVGPRGMFDRLILPEVVAVTVLDSDPHKYS